MLFGLKNGKNAIEMESKCTLKKYFDYNLI
jgi:hypothetical protein